MTRSFTRPSEVAARLALSFPGLYEDAEHALISTLTGGGREWVRGKLVDSYGGFDRKSTADLLAEKAARDEESRRRDAEAEARLSAESDPEFDALFEEVMAENDRYHARRRAEPEFDAAEKAREGQHRAAADLQKDPTYRKQVALLALNKYSVMCRFPSNVDKEWAAAIRDVAEKVLALPDDFREAVFPGFPPRLNVPAAKKMALQVLAQLARRSSPGFKPLDPRAY